MHQSGLKVPKTLMTKILTPDKWRVRNWKNHPIDPGWEDGRYCICHPRFRSSHTRYEGELVVDVVNDGNINTLGYLVRSYFQIRAIEQCKLSKTGEKDLLFDEYYFCDRNPGLYLEIHTAPLGTTLSQSQLDQLLTHKSYQKYYVSDHSRPVSIAAHDWDRMTQSRLLKMSQIATQAVTFQLPLTPA